MPPNDPPSPTTPLVVGVDFGRGESTTVVTLLFRSIREAVGIYEVLRDDPNVRDIEGRENADIPDQFQMNLTYVPGQQHPAGQQASEIVARHLVRIPAPLPPRREAGFAHVGSFQYVAPEPRAFVPNFPVARRVTVPLFEISANPTVSLEAITARRFDIIERYHPDEPMRVTVKKRPYCPTRYERVLDDVSSIPT